MKMSIIEIEIWNFWSLCELLITKLLILYNKFFKYEKYQE